MKVKLLKKVRKRYEIVRIDQLSNKPEKSLGMFELVWQRCLNECKKRHGIPFYVAKDNDQLNAFYCGHKEYDQVLEELRTKIRFDYAPKIKQQKEISVKLWHI